MSYDDIKEMKVGWDFLIPFSVFAMIFGGKYAVLKFIITFIVGYFFFNKGYWGGADVIVMAIVSAYTPLAVFGRVLITLGVVSSVLMMYMKAKNKKYFPFVPLITMCYLVTLLF